MGWFSIDMYGKKLKRYEIKKKRIQERLSRIGKSNKNYYINANTIFSLAKRVPEIFNSSEPEEKRQLIDFLFQNLELDGKNLEYKLKTPFKTMFLASKKNDCSIWGGRWDLNPQPLVPQTSALPLSYYHRVNYY